ncbi:hypothetical protein GCM10028820_25020 [Tessaracoccus terricola]
MNSVVDLGTLDHRLVGLQRPNGTTLTSGLCRAVAARVGIDPLLVRLAVAALTFAAGLGLVLYAWGTLLTPREGGVAPIRRFVPAFERWSRSTQGLVILISSLVVVIGSAAQGNVWLFPAVVVVGVFLLMRRRAVRTGTARHWGPQAPHAAAPGQGTSAPPPPSTAASIEEWRARLAGYATVRTGPADPLPVVDLYGPGTEQEQEPQAAPSQTQTPVSWLGASLVVLLSGGAAATAFVLGLSPTWLWACVLGTGVAGVTMLGHALLVRSRRLPVVLLVLALGVGATASWMVTERSEPVELVAAEAGEQDLTYEFIADGNAVVDLSSLTIDDDATITVEANLSNVRIILPAEPIRFTQSAEMSQVQIVGPESRDPDAERPRSSATLVLNAAMSNVVVEYLA